LLIIQRPAKLQIPALQRVMQSGEFVGNIVPFFRRRRYGGSRL